MTTLIFQIYYDAASRAALSSGFEPLDNSSNERPDWREYWPIKKYFNSVEKIDGYLGFFSPKFCEKTSLSPDQVERFVAGKEVDVISFSPFIDQSAFFKNIFEHGEANHPGLWQATSNLLKKISADQAVLEQCVPHEYFIFSNFFLANEKFWSLWRTVANALYEQAESGTDTEESKLLKLPAKYHEGQHVPMQVFVMERLASLVLHLNPSMTVASFPPFSMPSFGSRVSKYPGELAISNALKSKYRETKENIYLQMYEVRRQQLLSALQQ